jgi:hypothetical protein
VKFPFQFISVDGVEEAPVSAEKQKREIEEILDDYITPYDAPAARVADLAKALRENKPRVVHFIGHGNRFKELMFLDDEDKVYGANRQAIQAIFGMHRGDIRLVVLSACFSREQASMIHEHVESVIGVDQAIGIPVAGKYASRLYRILRTGQTIHDAHNEALQVVLKEKRVPEGQWPVLHTRARDSRAIIFPRPNPRLDQLRNERKEAFESDQGSCGVCVDSMTLFKETSPNGTSILHYDVKGLRVTHNEKVSGVYFQLESTAGLVYQPKPTTKSESLMYWDPPKDVPPPVTLAEVLKAKSSVKGVFRFKRKLTLKSGPFSFGWSVKVHNMDAFSRWEFENLYPLEEDRLHVDGSPLKPPVEFIARLVWLPLSGLTLRLKLQPTMPEVNFRCFDWISDKKIDKASVLSGGLLQSMPPDGLGTGLEAGGKESPWEARPDVGDLEGDQLYVDAEQIAEIRIDYPRLGSWYSLDWKLTDQRLGRFYQKLESEARVIRKKLSEHRAARRVDKETVKSAEIQRFLRELHTWLQGRFQKEIEEEIFETTIFSYVAKTREVAVCESVSGEGVFASEAGLAFHLPFGMGLAGACFRAGDGVLTYDNGASPDSDDPEIYLPNPGQPPHAYLLALPIDHPNFTLDKWEKGKIERSRQLVGVLTIGSNYEASGLREMCVKPPEKESEYAEWKQGIEAFRNDCQRRCDWLSNYLLGRTVENGKS